MKIIITGACAVSARSVVRSLRKSSLFCNSEFVGWDMATNLFGLYEGLFERIYKVPAVNSPDYDTIIRGILKMEMPDLVVPIPEVEVLYWSNNPFNIPCFTPPLNFCELAISKKKLFRLFENTDLIPKSIDTQKVVLLKNNFESPFGYPLWIRDSSAGTASGKGAFKANSKVELKAWIEINPSVESFQISEYLSGGNYGCFCLFKNGKLKKLAMAERIEYIMSKVAISGITGNTSKGKLINNYRIKDVALKAIEKVCLDTKTVMNGLVVVDLKGDKDNNPKVTEINIRHVAFSSLFASAGFNLSEYHILCALDREKELTEEIEMIYPVNNLILRDVDGLPIYLSEFQQIEIGEFVSNANQYIKNS
jgi:hypothetical protein